MSDESAQLEKAKTAFESGNYRDAEKALKSLSQDDPKVKHNLAVVRYLLQEIDAGEAISCLGSEPSDHNKQRFNSRAVVLEYEGHETAIYNKATLLAQAGNQHEAVTLLRGLLEISDDVALAVVVRALCLFQNLTRSASSLGQNPQKEADEKLIKAVLAKFPEMTKTPEYMELIAPAFVELDTLSEVYGNKTGEESQMSHLNNLGVLLLNSGKKNVASLCFAKAEKLVTEKHHTIQTPMLYNSGLCALLNGNYDEAIRNFLLIQDTMKNSPLFWLRFSEAAVNSVIKQRGILRREEYENDQNLISEEIRSGKLFTNFEFLMLPGAKMVPGPAQKEQPANKEDSTCAAMEQLAASAIQNALLLLIPQGYTYLSAIEGFEHNEQIITHAMLSWVALELMRSNYSVVVEVGLQLIEAHGQHPLTPSVHVTLLCYVVEALVRLNDADRALKVLKQVSFSQLVISNTEKLDSVHRCRVENLFINLTVTHIVNGSWSQAHNILNSLLGKIFESQPSSSADFRPEREILFAYQLLNIFLELSQGNQEKAAEALSKLTWVF